MTPLIVRLTLAALIAVITVSAGLVVTAQQARIALSGGADSCTTLPSLYRLGDTDTGYGIDATTNAGPCFVVNGVTVGAVTSTGQTTVDQAWGVLFDSSLQVPTKNALWDAFFVRALGAGVKVSNGLNLALDGSNPTTWPTGLVVGTFGCTVTLQGSAAPGLGTSVLTVTQTGGGTPSANVYAWKPTSISDPTLIASTGTELFNIACFGT